MSDRIFLHRYRVTEMVTDSSPESARNPSVHQGVDIETRRMVMIETYSADSLTSAAREQLRAEANAARDLRHVNIPVLYDFGIENERLVYVSEHFDGTVAEDWVRKYGPMPVSPVLNIASQVVSALSAAAFHRIIHPKINPRDLLLSPGQTADGEWPLVKVLHLTGGSLKLSMSGRVAPDSDNLAPYSSPEQVQHGTIDFRSEMYSLGATMWFLLTGAPPPMARKEQPARRGPASDILNGVPRSVRELLGQMLSTSPDLRPGDPLAFSRLLQESTAHLHVRESTAKETPHAASKRIATEVGETESQWNRKRVLVVAAVPVALAAVAFAVFQYSRPRQSVTVQKPVRAATHIPPGPSAAPVGAPKANATSVADVNSTGGSENTITPHVESDLVQRAAINLAPPSIWPKALNLFRVPRPPMAAYAPPSAIGAFPDAISSSKAVATSTQVEVPTTARSIPVTTSATPAQKKVTARQTRSTAAEVRRAAPAPPAEGPAEKSKPTAAPKSTPSIRDNARAPGR